MNALRHGLDAAPGVLLPGEDPAERDALARVYREDLRPVTREEEALVGRMAETTWLQRRAEAAAYAAAEEAIATHGPGTNVLVLECEAGGRGPFLRAEAWNCRLTGRLIRLVRLIDRARRAARGVPVSRGTKPLSLAGAGGTAPANADPSRGRSGPSCAERLAARNKAIAHHTARPTPRPEWSDGPDALAKRHLPAPARRSEASQGSPRDVCAPTENKAIAPPNRPTPATVPMPTTGNKAIATPRAGRNLARAVGSVVAGLVGGRGAIRPAYTTGAEQTHCSSLYNSTCPHGK